MKRTIIYMTACLAFAAGCASTSTTSQSVHLTIPLEDGYQHWDAGNDAVIWKWISNPLCKSYQSGCWGIALQAVTSCPGGVYIDVAEVNSDGVIVGDGNELTPALQIGDKANAVISPPGGLGANAKGRLTKLDCLS